MWPISMPRADSSVPSSQLGQASPSRTSAASMVPSGVKSRPTTMSMTCEPGTLAPVTQRVPSTMRGSTRKRMPDSSDSSPSAPGPM